MRIQRIFSTPAAIGLVLLYLFPAVSTAQEAPIKITLVSDKKHYNPDDRIELQIRMLNNSSDSQKNEPYVITHRDFFHRDYHLLLTINDPDGMPIPRKHAVIAKEPAPPYSIDGHLFVPVDIIDSKFQKVWFINDAKQLYNFEGKFGWYTAFLRTSLETFSRSVRMPSGKEMADLLDKGRETYNSVTSNRVRFEIAPPKQMFSPLIVQVKESNYQSKSRLKGVTPIMAPAAVHVYSRSQIPKRYLPANSKTFGYIWNNVRPVKSTLTNPAGVANFSRLVQGDYLILARDTSPPTSLFLGGIVSASDKVWWTSEPIVLHLKKVPSK